jgi:molybdenum-dependent DNA-binding transcriptional regulator ModE
MPTGDVLTKVREQFPTAKTSASCIAYYKAALKNPNLGKRKGGVSTDPAALRAKAAELMAAAQAAEAANAEAAVKAAEEAVAKAEVAKKAAEAALAAQAALKEQQAAAQAPAA